MEVIIGLFGFLLLVVGVIAFVASFFWPSITQEVAVLDADGKPTKDRYGNIDTTDKTVTMPGRKAALIGGPIAVILGFLIMGVKIIPSGNVGVVITAGTVNTEERQPGISWVMPFIDGIHNFSTRVEAYEFKDLGAASKEYQDVFLTGVLNYHISPTGAAELFVQYNDDYVTKLIVPYFNDTVKEITAKFGVADVLPQRDVIRSQAVARLQEKLSPIGIFVDDIAFSNVNFNEEYNQAIQNKQIQQLQIQTEQNILSQRKVQAEQAAAQAKGEADANIERARGQAQALLLNRQAEAEGNAAVAASLTQPILTQMAIDKFNPAVKIVLMPPSSDGGSQFIFPPELINPDPTPAP